MLRLKPLIFFLFVALAAGAAEAQTASRRRSKG